MNKLLTSIVFGTSLLLSACTVHHYHHQVPSKGDKAGACKHHGKKGHGKKGYHALPEGHPPVEGHGKKGHHAMPEGHPPVGGHGMKGHHGMPEGHPRVDGHGTKGHHGEMKGHGSMKGHHGGMTGNHGEDAEHKKMHADLPAGVNAFHESFAPVWHLESDEARSAGGCAKASEWETLAKGVGQHKAQRDQAIAYSAAAKSLAEKVKAVSTACRQKKASVQAELTAAHDALHGVMKALAK